jgi:hypothetical protein
MYPALGSLVGLNITVAVRHRTYLGSVEALDIARADDAQNQIFRNHRDSDCHCHRPWAMTLPERANLGKQTVSKVNGSVN